LLRLYRGGGIILCRSTYIEMMRKFANKIVPSCFAILRSFKNVIAIIFVLFVFPNGPTMLTGAYSFEKSETDSEKIKKIEALYEGYRSGGRYFGEVAEITSSELFQMKNEGKVILVDSRTPDEYSVSMIPDTITKVEFESNLDVYKNATIVVYCTIGVRSGRYVESLLNAGFDAYNLKGGVLSWAHGGGKFVDRNGNETKRVHVFGSKWNLLPAGYEPIE
jgi:rhodanese-related sulfurtransferase